jgi:hypothetical protein
MQHLEEKILAHPEFAEPFKEWVCLAAAEKAFKREEARLNALQSIPLAEQQGFTKAATELRRHTLPQ